MYSSKLFLSWIGLHTSLGQMFKFSPSRSSSTSSSTLPSLIAGSFAGYPKWDLAPLELSQKATDYTGDGLDYIMLNFNSIKQIFSSIQKYSKEKELPISDDFITAVKDIVFTLADMLLNVKLNTANINPDTYKNLSDSKNIAKELIVILLEYCKGKEDEAIKHKDLLSSLESQQLLLNSATSLLSDNKYTPLSDSKKAKIEIADDQEDSNPALSVVNQTKSSSSSSGRLSNN